MQFKTTSAHPEHSIQTPDPIHLNASISYRHLYVPIEFRSICPLPGFQMKKPPLPVLHSVPLPRQTGRRVPLETAERKVGWSWEEKLFILLSLQWANHRELKSERENPHSSIEIQFFTHTSFLLALKWALVPHLHSHFEESNASVWAFSPFINPCVNNLRHPIPNFFKTIQFQSWRFEQRTNFQSSV